MFVIEPHPSIPFLYARKGSTCTIPEYLMDVSNPRKLKLVTSHITVGGEADISGESSLIQNHGTIMILL